MSLRLEKNLESIEIQCFSGFYVLGRADSRSEESPLFLVLVVVTIVVTIASEVKRMIEKEHFHVLNYVKKEEYSASMDGMRYMLKKKEVGDDTKLEVIIWPEPYCFAKTEEEKKQRKEFEFSASGVEMAADWLNEQYVKQKPLWELSKKMKI